MKNKKEKKEYVDDGHTIYNMDVDGMRHRRIKSGNVYLTKKEKRAAMLAAFMHYGPIFLGVIACFTLAMLLIYFWLK